MLAFSELKKAMLDFKLKKQTFKSNYYYYYYYYYCFHYFLGGNNTRTCSSWSSRIQEQSNPEQLHNQTQSNAKFHTKSLSSTETSRTWKNHQTQTHMRKPTQENHQTSNLEKCQTQKPPTQNMNFNLHVLLQIKANPID